MKQQYKIKKITLITYDGNEITINNIIDKVISTPIKSVKEKILDSFSTMEDKPVKVKLKTEDVCEEKHS